MIGYYIHHHGLGHLTRALSICSQMRQPVVALTSLEVREPHPFAAVVRLDRDDQQARHRDPSAQGALHWAPQHDDGYSRRMAEVARWAAEARPAAFVVDVSVEVAVFVRLLGVPVVVMALPGDRADAPHALAHRLADHIVAAWPRELYLPDWLRPHEDKTSYVGGISRFDGRDAAADAPEGPGSAMRVLVFGGSGEVFGAQSAAAERACPGATWRVLGGEGNPWSDDPWPALCSADVVVTHAGQGCVADVAAAQRPAVVIPQPRPFGEQRATGEALRGHGLATVLDEWPAASDWPTVLARARAVRNGWSRWEARGAAARAARAIESAARGHRGRPEDAVS